MTSIFEVVSKDHQKLQLATSGTVELSRPDKIHTTRKSGFSDTEMVFDGKTVSILGKGQNAYVQADAPGTVDNLIDQLRDKFHRQLPGADLLQSNVYEDADGRRHRYQGSRQRRDQRPGVRPPRVPRQGHRLADLDRPGRNSPIPAAT